MLERDFSPPTPMVVDEEETDKVKDLEEKDKSKDKVVEEEELKGETNEPEKEGPNEGEFVRNPQMLKNDQKETKIQQFLELFK